MSRAKPETFSERIGLRLCGIAEEPFCPWSKRLFGFLHFGALQVAHFDGEFFQRTGDDRQRREIIGVAVALNDLIGHQRRLETGLAAHIGFDFGRDLREGAHRAGNLADANVVDRGIFESATRWRAIS